MMNINIFGPDILHNTIYESLLYSSMNHMQKARKGDSVPSFIMYKCYFLNLVLKEIQYNDDYIPGFDFKQYNKKSYLQDGIADSKQPRMSIFFFFFPVIHVCVKN